MAPSKYRTNLDSLPAVRVLRIGVDDASGQHVEAGNRVGFAELVLRHAGPLSGVLSEGVQNVKGDVAEVVRCAETMAVRQRNAVMEPAMESLKRVTSTPRRRQQF